MNRLKKLWIDLNSSLWFLPGIIVICSIFLALGLVEFDKRIGENWISGYPRLFGVEPSGSRDMLAAVAGSMITVAGIVFSIVIVALSLASTQYTPRILRNFMRDQINQVVLGVFVGIFTYCIVVLRTIRGGDNDQVFVPSIAVIVGVLLALVGIGFLIYFIHHIAVSIQASTIIAEIADETIEVIDELFPHRIGENAPLAKLDELEDFSEDAAWTQICAASTGYIQNIDIAALLDFTRQNDVVVKMEHGVGEFVIAGAALAAVTRAENSKHSNMTVGKQLTDSFNRIYAIDNFRTIDQDVAFGIRQIVDVVMKALSPGINDTTTAVICIDYLTAICSHLAPHPFPTRFRFAEGRLQVIAKRPSFEDLLDLAFNQTRQNAGNNVAVILRTLHALERIALRIKNGYDLRGQKLELPNEEYKARLKTILRHLQIVTVEALDQNHSETDLAQIEEHSSKIAATLNQYFSLTKES